ncbi:MAG: hypothetical protein SGI89_10295 [bacterium]|nr:hypothetical protein [bacterium]
MHDSNLINLLRTFSKEEMKRFGLFVQSPFYNREKILIKFVSVLIKYHPEFGVEEMPKKKIYASILPGKAYNDALMRNTVSDLLRLAEEFLKVIRANKDAFYSRYNIMKELTDRKQKTLFSMNFRKAKNALESSGVLDEIYYQNSFLLEDEKRRNVVVNSSRILYKDDNLQQQADSIHLQHLVEDIKLYAIMLNQKKFTYEHNFDFTLSETLRTYIEENFHLYRNIPYIAIFYNCVMLYKTEDKKYFDELRIQTKKHFKKLSHTDRKNMFMVLTNHGYLQIRRGNFEFYDELFEVNKDFIKTKAYLEGNDFMAHYIYSSIAMNAADIGKTDWAENFLNKYLKLVHSDYRKSSYNICMASIHLARKEYDNALEKLSVIIPWDNSAKLSVDLLQLKIYFSKNETESFLSMTDSMRHFLKRNKDIKNESRIVYGNFVLFLKKLYLLKISSPDIDKSKLYMLKKKIQDNNEIMAKKWLLEKVDEIFQ